MPQIIIPAAVAVGTTIYSTQQQKKAQKAAMEFADQQQQESMAEQRRLEEKYGLTEGELAAYEGRTTEAARRAGLSGEELMKEAGPTTQALMERVGTRAGKTGEELFQEEGTLAKQLYGEATSDDPTAMFAPELELTRQMVNQEANKRGVFNGLPEGGIRFEQLGRAGVDLAIKSARERLSQRNAIMNTVLNLSSGARQEAGVVGERALSTGERARSELDALLSSAQGRSMQATGMGESVRNTGTGTSADIYSSIYGQEYGEAAATKSAGLSELGKSTDALLSYLSTEKTANTTTPKFSYDEYLNTKNRDPFADLLERTKGFGGG